MKATQVQHECYTNNTSEKRVKNIDFDNDTGKNIFLLLTFTIWQLQGKEQFHTKNYLFKMSRFHAKMRLKSPPQKINFLMAKAISKSCTLDCTCKYPCTFSHSKAASFSIKTILRENINILLEYQHSLEN